MRYFAKNDFLKGKITQKYENYYNKIHQVCRSIQVNLPSSLIQMGLSEFEMEPDSQQITHL
jgi:hypothetical protein